MGESDQLATKGDFLRLENKVDGLAQSVGILSTAVAVLQNRPVHNPPCPDYLRLEEEFNDHLDDHENIKKDWRGGFISFFFGLISTAIIGSIGYFLGSKQ